jgi:hypothetical protein
MMVRRLSKTLCVSIARLHMISALLAKQANGSNFGKNVHMFW